jgi:hypothetical protein
MEIMITSCYHTLLAMNLMLAHDLLHVTTIPQLHWMSASRFKCGGTWGSRSSPMPWPLGFPQLPPIGK